MAEDYYARMALYRKRMKDMIKRAALSTWVSVERVIGGCVCTSRCIKRGGGGYLGDRGAIQQEQSDITPALLYAELTTRLFLKVNLHLPSPPKR